LVLRIAVTVWAGIGASLLFFAARTEQVPRAFHPILMVGWLGLSGGLIGFLCGPPGAPWDGEASPGRANRPNPPATDSQIEMRETRSSAPARH
jgi:hypothetical protein